MRRKRHALEYEPVAQAQTISNVSLANSTALSDAVLLGNDTDVTNMTSLDNDVTVEEVCTRRVCKQLAVMCLLCGSAAHTSHVRGSYDK